MSESGQFDRAQIGSRGGNTDIGSNADTAGRSLDNDAVVNTTPSQKVHPWVEPFYSHLEVMDFAASQRMKYLKNRGDKSKAMHRADRMSTIRRNISHTPVHNPVPGTQKGVSFARRQRRHFQSDVYMSYDDVDLRHLPSTNESNLQGGLHQPDPTLPHYDKP